MKRDSQQGVALVITLILLSVITFMAITFLAVSRRESQAVNVQADQTGSDLAADIAFERAKAASVVPIMTHSNAQLIELRVSTNYISRFGFTPGLVSPNPTNVNYDYTAGGGQLNANHRQQNIANLLYDPRPPVYIRTNGAPPGVSEFRFYLDLNRNGRFDPTGYFGVTNNLGQSILGANGLPITNYFVGDPEWVGVLERPEFPHSATNKFVARWAYIVLPAGAALDLNYIHNQAFARALNPGNDGYQRHQGYGSWEINLAAFLRDLNTNFWSYSYNRPARFANSGTAFEDAQSLLRYRYNGRYDSLNTVQFLFGPLGGGAFVRDNIDAYVDDDPLVNILPLAVPVENDVPRLPWPGADSVQHFFTTQDLYDRNKTSVMFVNRLLNASTNRSSYDQYTYYRLLSQLTTDSSPEPSVKMNLNYDNLVQQNPISGVIGATNFIPWRPIDFFTNAANRMLQSAAGLTTTNISIYPTNDYTPAIHRLMQLAANLYDSTTNRSLTPYPHLPSVFRPRFGVNGTNIFISGYVEETRPASAWLATPVRNLNNAADRDALASQPDDFVYGVPLVIGAKEGFPNFNEYSMQTIVQITRKLELRRPNNLSLPNETNQMFVVGISNVFAVEGWNSYTNPFPRELDMYVTNELSIVMTNQFGLLRATNLTLRQILPVNIPADAWKGLVNPQYAQQSFRIPLLTNVIFLTNSVYQQQPLPGSFASLSAEFERGIGFPVPQWGLNITNNRLRYVLVDRATQRVVDFVNLNGMDAHLDLTRELIGNSEPQGGETSTMGNQWRTNRPNNAPSIFVPTVGIINQIEVSLGNQTVSLRDWNNYSLQGINGDDKNKAIDGFRVFMGLSPVFYPLTFNSNLVQQAPFTPSRKIYHNTSYQANDPLVHYTLGDLTDLVRTNDVNFIIPSQPAPFMPNLSKINGRYQPWGGNPNQSTDPNAFNLALKDPLVKRSDDWDFWTNKYANLGEIGRVHRGTPWQTIYLKSTPVDDSAWQKWTGNGYTIDASRSQPINDRQLLDLFTVAPNDNASRGQMSINVADIAGWSAILSGVIVLTNSATDAELNVTPPLVKVDPLVVEPAGTSGTNSPLFRIVAALNRDRTNVTVHPDQTFHRLGDILGTPELTVASPFLNLTNSAQLTKGLSDAVYERIPQQILSLLKVGEPRFVIYSYGQTLKPADRANLQGGQFSGMITNYQITGETATRTVIRIEGAPNNPRSVIERFNVLPPE